MDRSEKKQTIERRDEINGREGRRNEKRDGINSRERRGTNGEAKRKERQNKWKGVVGRARMNGG